MVSPRTKLLAWTLVALAFFSKISFSFTGAVPSSLGFLLFQGGLHPYGNVALNLVVGLALFWSVKKGREWPSLRAYHPFYLAFTF